MTDSRGTLLLAKAFSCMDQKKYKLILLGDKHSAYAKKIRQVLQGCNFSIFERVLHPKMVDLYQSADVVVSDLAIGSVSVVTAEAMACGRPVIQYLKKEAYTYAKIPLPPIFPLKKRTVEDVAEALTGCYGDMKRQKQIIEAARLYVQEHHDAKKVAKQVSEIYAQVFPGNV